MPQELPLKFVQLKKLLDDWYKAKRAAAAAKSAENKAHKVASKAFVAYMTAEGKPISAPLGVGDTHYTYSPATTNRIDPEEWHRMWQSGEITKEQYFEALSVTKDAADRIVGGDQVEAISKPITGKTSTLRFHDEPVQVADARPRMLALPRPAPQAEETDLDLQPSAKTVKPLRKLTLTRKS